MFSQSNVNFNTETVFKGTFRTTYKGVMALKCPFDYVIYQMLIFQIEPDLIIEIGTNKGGSALYMADLLSMIGKGIVHTIDVDNNAALQIRRHQRIEQFTGGYQNYDLNLAEGYKKVMVIDDGSHFYEDVAAALHKFSPLVSPGSYFIVEDGIIDKLGWAKRYNGGPLKAIHQFMKHRTDFVVDRSFCDMFGKNATFNVDGYLKKV